MKLHAALLSLCLAGCVATPPAENSDAMIHAGYLKGHLEMLDTHAPWMSDAQKQAHAEAQATEVMKSIHLQQQTGAVVPPVIIPIGAPPAGAPSAPNSGAAVAATAAPQPTPVSAPPVVASETLTPPPAPDTQQKLMVALAGALAQDEQATGNNQGTDLRVVGNQDFVAGIYVMEGGSYSIQVTAKGADLLVIEPNRSSLYRRQNDGSYQFHNRNTGSTFSLRVMNERALLLDRVPSSGSPTRMLREKEFRGDLHSNSEALQEIAERYRQRALSDPEDAQLWTLCSAAAYKRSISDDEENARYARQIAASIRQILVSSSNPCPDAISAEHW